LVKRSSLTAEQLAREAQAHGWLAWTTLPSRATLGWVPNAGQRRIIERAGRRRIIACANGRRSGKSTLAAHVAAGFGSVAPEEVWIVGPTYEIAGRTFDLTCDVLRRLRALKALHISTRVATTYAGGRIRCKSADHQDSLIGAGLALVIVDEWASLPPRVWYQALRPALADRGGVALLIGTPRGEGWAADLWRAGRDGQDPDVFAIAEPSWSNDVVFPGGEADPEIARMREAYARAGMLALYRQEVEASWDALQGRVYQAFSPSQHVRPQPQVAVGVTSVVIGVDWGYRNPCVALAVGRTHDDAIRVLDEWRATGATPGEQVAGIVALARKWRAARAVCDPSEPGQIEALRRAGLPAHGADNDVSAGILRVAQALPTMLVSDTCGEFIREMLAYQYAERGVAREEPVKANDHGPDALRYAVVSGWVTGRPKAVWLMQAPA